MKTSKGYKLFEQDTMGNLYPLFIGKKNSTPIKKWEKAEILPTKGFAVRPGWHIGIRIPSAPWLMSYNGTYKTTRGKKFKRVWCEVEYVANIDYTKDVLKLPKKCFTDRLPTNGFYEFKESGDRLWIIADRIKVVKILTEEERQKILKDMNYNEQIAFEPYKKAMAKRMRRN